MPVAKGPPKAPAPTTAMEDLDHLQNRFPRKGEVRDKREWRVATGLGKSLRKGAKEVIDAPFRW